MAGQFFRALCYVCQLSNAVCTEVHNSSSHQYRVNSSKCRSEVDKTYKMWFICLCSQHKLMYSKHKDTCRTEAIVLSLLIALSMCTFPEALSCRKFRPGSKFVQVLLQDIEATAETLRYRSVVVKVRILLHCCKHISLICLNCRCHITTPLQFLRSRSLNHFAAYATYLHHWQKQMTSGL